MAQRVLDVGTQLAEGAVIFGNQKQRIIPEAAVAAILGDDAPMAAALDDRVDCTPRIGQRRGANVIRLPGIGAQRRQLGE